MAILWIVVAILYSGGYTLSTTYLDLVSVIDQEIYEHIRGY